MKYSEVKHILKWLHIAGWEKVKGFGIYKKTWEEGDLKYSQSLDFEVLKITQLPITYVLHEFDVKAAKAFYELG